MYLILCRHFENTSVFSLSNPTLWLKRNLYRRHPLNSASQPWCFSPQNLPPNHFIPLLWPRNCHLINREIYKQTQKLCNLSKRFFFLLSFIYKFIAVSQTVNRFFNRKTHFSGIYFIPLKKKFIIRNRLSLF